MNLRPAIGLVSPATGVSASATETTPSQIRWRVMELIADVGAYPMEDLKPEQRLGMDLGFDSLMRVNLYVSLTEAFPGARDLPQTMIGGETTIEELARSVAEVIAGTEKTTTSENIGPRTVVYVNQPPRTSGEGILGVGLEDEPVADRAFIRLSTDEYPWLEDHRIGRKFLVPFAFMLDQAAAAAERLGLGPTVSLSNTQVWGDATVPAAGKNFLAVAASASRSHAEIEVDLIAASSRILLMRVDASAASARLPLLKLPVGGEAPGLSISDFYQQWTFHGPRFRALGSVTKIGPTHAIGLLGVGTVGRVGGTALDILSLDAMLQLCAYWESVTMGRVGVPISAAEVRVLGRPSRSSADTMHCCWSTKRIRLGCWEIPAAVSASIVMSNVRMLTYGWGPSPNRLHHVEVTLRVPRK